MTTSPEGKNIVWHDSECTPQDRQAALRQSGCVLWFTGLSGSGKSTLAHALERKLVQMGQAAYVLDGDNVRHGLCSDLGFSKEDRDENIRRIANVSGLFADAGMICITAFISPYRALREQARQIIGPDRFLEIHIATPIEECERRDVKGMYKKARSGDIKGFTGVDDPWEPPVTPACRLDTTGREVEEQIRELVALLYDRGKMGDPAGLGL